MLDEAVRHSRAVAEGGAEADHEVPAEVRRPDVEPGLARKVHQVAGRKEVEGHPRDPALLVQNGPELVAAAGSSIPQVSTGSARAVRVGAKGTDQEKSTNRS